jgi:putative PIN family toxin of toxin-antitoxin system
VHDGRLIPVASWQLAEEVAEVLRRPKLRDRYGVTEQDVQDVLVLLAPFLPSVETDAPVRDVDDAPVISSAVTARAEAIVTGDQDLLERGALRDWLAEREVSVLTAAEVLARIGR